MGECQAILYSPLSGHWLGKLCMNAVHSPFMFSMVSVSLLSMFPMFLHLSSALLLVHRSVPLFSSYHPSEPHVVWIFDLLTDLSSAWPRARPAPCWCIKRSGPDPGSVRTGSILCSVAYGPRLVLTQGQFERVLALLRCIRAGPYNGTALFTQQ